MMMERLTFAVRPEKGQIHGRVPAVPRRRGAQGRERGHSGHEEQTSHPIR